MKASNLGGAYPSWIAEPQKRNRKKKRNKKYVLLKIWLTKL
jgi:hypothetical protein